MTDVIYIGAHIGRDEKGIIETMNNIKKKWRKRFTDICI